MSSVSHDHDLPPLISALRSASAYSHPIARVEVIETHISWVLLTGKFAYKIKKPRNLGFLDFSTLPRRKACCEAELELNRRYAAQLYLGVIPITGPVATPHMGGVGEPIEFAVKMRQFDPGLCLDRLALKDNRLDHSVWCRLAESLAAFHAAAAVATEADNYGLPDLIEAATEHNFAHLESGFAAVMEMAAAIARLHAWSRGEFQRLRDFMLARKREGRVREVHGDLHLGNIVLLDDQPMPFDGIEFNPELRWLDLMSEMAFPLMDLDVRGFSEAAFRLLNRYLEITGDYPGLRLLDFFRVYRALVRAKVACIKGIAAERSKTPQQPGAEDYVRYADTLTRARRVHLIITHGYSGSGKSSVAEELAARLPAIRLRSDLERKRLTGRPAGAKTDPCDREITYGAPATEATYRRLGELAEMILNCGFSVIVDATFLDRDCREAFKQVAERVGSGFRILNCTAPTEILRERVAERLAIGKDASEADLQVLALQIQHAHPLSAQEQPDTVSIDSSRATNWKELLGALTG